MIHSFLPFSYNATRHFTFHRRETDALPADRFAVMQVYIHRGHNGYKGMAVNNPLGKVVTLHTLHMCISWYGDKIIPANGNDNDQESIYVLYIHMYIRYLRRNGHRPSEFLGNFVFL